MAQKLANLIRPEVSQHFSREIPGLSRLICQMISRDISIFQLFRVNLKLSMWSVTTVAPRNRIPPSCPWLSSNRFLPTTSPSAPAPGHPCGGYVGKAALPLAPALETAGKGQWCYCWQGRVGSWLLVARIICVHVAIILMTVVGIVICIVALNAHMLVVGSI